MQALVQAALSSQCHQESSPGDRFQHGAASAQAGLAAMAQSTQACSGTSASSITVFSKAALSCCPLLQGRTLHPKP